MAIINSKKVMIHWKFYQKVIIQFNENIKFLRLILIILQKKKLI